MDMAVRASAPRGHGPPLRRPAARTAGFVEWARAAAASLRTRERRAARGELRDRLC